MIIFNEDENPEREARFNFTQTIIVMILGTSLFWISGFIFPKDIFKQKILQNEFITNDDITFSMQQDSLELSKHEIPDSISLIFFDAQKAQKPSGSFDFNIVETNKEGKGLSKFFEKLYKLETTKNGNIRIAYYGDSMIEDDYIVHTIRSLLQKKYGGNGVGLVPISLPNLSGRHTIKHNFSQNWQTSSLIKRKFSPIGVSGTVSYSLDSDSLWVSYKSGTQKIYNPVLIYGKSNNMNGKVHVSSQNDKREISLNPQNSINSLNINTEKDSISLIFYDVDSIPFFGINFTTQNGIFVDNFSIRGSSGLPLIYLDKPLMNAFQKKFDYDLIILQFGANVIKSDIKKYKWYSEKMTKVVEHIRECFPQADILIISAADKAAKYGNKIQTDSLIYPLLRSQREYALTTNSSFINLFKIMGGEGTMAKWVNEYPPLGAKDFIHFSPTGAKIIANAVYEKLEEEYQNYKNIKSGGSN
ncbi:MAG: hypothetical protein LBH98_07000 [Chitinispirillales bacterium]|jgi:lysophospholipase L1-like esterase|nr:hypothetical protein [Chitinispirillales bacterium]